MFSLRIDNSESQVTGFTSEQFNDLKELLSYSLPPQRNFYTGGYKSQKRTLLDQKGRFPTGIVSLVFDFIKKNGLKCNIKDIRSRPKSSKPFVKITGVEPYKEQLEAVEAAIKHHRGIIQMPTGFGKSITMVLLIAKLQLKTLIVVPNLGLKHQLTEVMTKFLGKTKNIRVENIDSPALEKLCDFDCLIIDEAHHAAAKTYRRLNKKVWKDIYYRFCFTATPFRSRDEEQLLMESVTSQVIYSVSYDSAVSSGFIVPMEAYYYEVPKTVTTKNQWAGVYSDLVVNHKRRNYLISVLLLNLQDAGKSTLCIVNEIEHGKNVAESGGIPFAYGENQETPDLIKKFNEGRIKVLIGTGGILGEGLDTKPAEYIIIAGLGKAKNRFMQQCGRGFRKYPGKESVKVILFKDVSHKWTKAHFAAQVKILKDEYNLIPVKLSL